MTLAKLAGPVSATMAVRVQDDNYNLPTNSINEPVSQSLAFGTSAGQANLLSSVEYSIALSATQTLVLDNASLADVFGNAVSLSNAKVLRVHHKPDSLASSVSLGGTFTVNWTSGTDQWVLPLGKNDFILINISNLAQAVGAGETLTLLNNDGALAATVALDIFGD